MNIAKNVVVHDPETDPTKINAQRLEAHGWPQGAVQYFQQGQLNIETVGYTNKKRDAST
jgi:hypothetical protein